MVNKCTIRVQIRVQLEPNKGSNLGENIQPRISNNEKNILVTFSKKMVKSELNNIPKLRRLKTP